MGGQYSVSITQILSKQVTSRTVTSGFTKRGTTSLDGRRNHGLCQPFLVPIEFGKRNPRPKGKRDRPYNFLMFYHLNGLKRTTHRSVFLTFYRILNQVKGISMDATEHSDLTGFEMCTGTRLIQFQKINVYFYRRIVSKKISKFLINESWETLGLYQDLYVVTHFIIPFF